MESLKDVLPDFDPGPLDVYRKRASFHWREMKLALEPEHDIRVKAKIWKNLEADPVFSRSLTEEKSWQEEHHVAYKRMKSLEELNLFSPEKAFTDLKGSCVILLAVSDYDMSVATKLGLSSFLFQYVVMNSNYKDRFNVAEMIAKSEIVGCFAMTELGHGSNLKNIGTTATFCPETQEFILHSPTLEASKMWIGNLGQTATHAVVYAKLCTPDGQCHGVHPFLTPIRDLKTFLPYPGITVADLGPKLGLNGIDNGFMVFNNYCIPKDNLLSRSVVLTDTGKCISKGTRGKPNFSQVLLSFNRIIVIQLCSSLMRHSISIAVRYSAVRKQFGPCDSDDELPVIEYQVQQWRLFPFIAAAYVSFHTSRTCMMRLMDEIVGVSFGETSREQIEIIAYNHALSCCGKAVTSWIASECVQQCREACGGHGYLKAAGFKELRSESDASCTYEGANNVIIQQTSKYLINIYWRKISSNENPPSHLEDIAFIGSINDILQSKFPLQNIEEEISSSLVISMYEWLVCYLLVKSGEKYKLEMEKSNSEFLATCNSQVFYCHSLAVSFYHFTALRSFYSLVEQQEEPNVRLVLDKLCRLYGLWTLEKYLDCLYSGGYCSGRLLDFLVKENILKLCKELKDEAVALVDAIAPPDFILMSALGRSDGKVYEALRDAIMNTPGAQDRPPWWKEFTEKSKISKL